MKRRKEVARSNRCIILFLNPNGHAINQLKEGLTEMDANRALKCRASIQWSVAACERKQSQKKRLRTCHGRCANGMQPFICLLNSSIQWIATVSGDEWANENRIIHSLARSLSRWLLAVATAPPPPSLAGEWWQRAANRIGEKGDCESTKQLFHLHSFISLPYHSNIHSIHPFILPFVLTINSYQSLGDWLVGWKEGRRGAGEGE